MTGLLLAAFGAAFLQVALKTFQQRNVIHDNWGLVVPTSYGLAFTEAFLVFTVARHGVFLPMVLAIGTGAAFGCVLSMLFHKRVILKEGR